MIRNDKRKGKKSMTEQQKKGQIYIIGVIAGGAVAELCTVAISVNLIRIMLSCIVWYFLYQGHRWAKYLLTALNGIAAVFGAFTVTGFVLGGMVSLYVWVLFFITTIYMVSVLILVVSKDAKAFLDRKRN